MARIGIATANLDLELRGDAPASPLSPVSPFFQYPSSPERARDDLELDLDLDAPFAPRTLPDIAFCHRLPKVELHAHLTGSISRATLQAIWEERAAAEGELGIEAPIVALQDPSQAQGIDVFFSHFNSYIYHLISTPDALAKATRSVLAEFASDGVAYLELRTTPRAMMPKRGPGTSAEQSLRIVVGELNRWNAEHGDIMPARLIVAVDRAKHDVNAAEWIVDLALRLRDEGAPIVALDLCGDPHKIIDVSTLRAPFLRAAHQGLPCVLHFAEVPVSSHSAELEELLSWRPRRLGHAIHVPPAMRERILARGAAPELCLSCNVLAGMLPPRLSEPESTFLSKAIYGGEAHPPVHPHQCRPASFVDHHFGWWWAAGGPLSLGTDDVGVFGSPSSNEHHHAAQHFGLSRRDLVDLSRRAMAGSLGGSYDELRMDRLLDDFTRREGIEIEHVEQAFGFTEML